MFAHRLFYRFTLTVLILCPLLWNTLYAQSVAPRVDSLLNEMTLEEKVGQMTQIALEVVSAKKGTLNQSHALDPEKLRTALTDYHIGSILNVWDRAFTVNHWHEVITTIQDIATRETRLGIPVLYGIDAVHGANYTQGATIFPQSMNMAATWNPELVELEGEITAREVRASGIPWNFNPVLGVARHPAWPRFWETYGESGYVASILGAAYIRGQQGQDMGASDRVGTCVKHFIGYSYPRTGRDRTPAWIPERQLREIFLPPFRAGIESGSPTVMLNSSEINGVPVHSSKYYQRTLLEDELGFEGIIITDWADINNLYTRENVAATQREAVKMAVLAGVDMSMVPLDYSFYTHLIDLVRTGEVPESRINEAVRDILTFKYQLGLFENPYPNKQLTDQFATDEARRVNLQAARESLVLLKNQNDLLPLDTKSQVLVTGPTANSLASLNGGWTITWQGDQEEMYPEDKLTILEAIESTLGGNQVVYSRGVDFHQSLHIEKTVAAAREAEVAIVALGEPAYCESAGNIDDLTMPEPQLNLVEALSETDTPIILVLAEGRPRIINRIAGKVDAILFAGLPGMEGGPAIADVLFGDYNPGGKLPFTYPRNPNALVWYDHKESEENDPGEFNPQFEFGDGLSYTSFAYSDLQIGNPKVGTSSKLNVTVRVTNTGDRSGKEPVLLFLRDHIASITPSVKKLVRFDQVNLQPGESTLVQFELSARDLSFIGRDHSRIIEPGMFSVSVDTLSQQFEFTADTPDEIE